MAMTKYRSKASTLRQLTALSENANNDSLHLALNDKFTLKFPATSCCENCFSTKVPPHEM